MNTQQNYQLRLLRLAAGEPGDVPATEQTIDFEVERLTILATAREAKRRGDLSSFAAWFRTCFVATCTHIVDAVREALRAFARGLASESETLLHIEQVCVAS